MTDPMIAAARELLTTALGDLRPAIDGAPAEAVNWRPGGEDTNSIAVLVTHSTHSTRAWLSRSIDAPPPKRDRDSEFVAKALDAKELLSLIDAFGGECDALLADAGAIDWTALRQTQLRPRPGASEEVTAAWALVHAIEHLREHIGQITLTRQLWERRSA